MIGESYPFLDENYNAETDVLFFTFFSQGEVVLPKAIAFTPIEKNGEKYYNWGFGDLVQDEKTGQFKIDDRTESNNGDFKTIFYTVISTLPSFFDIHSEATVHIEGSDEQRMDVYRKLIVRHWRQIEPFYEIKGSVKGEIRAFEGGIEFEYVLLSRKKTVNL